jgi:hypothetical protein
MRLTLYQLFILMGGGNPESDIQMDEWAYPFGCFRGKESEGYLPKLNASSSRNQSCLSRGGIQNGSHHHPGAFDPLGETC